MPVTAREERHEEVNDAGRHVAEDPRRRTRRAPLENDVDRQENEAPADRREQEEGRGEDENPLHRQLEREHGVEPRNIRATAARRNAPWRARFRWPGGEQADRDEKERQGDQDADRVSPRVKSDRRSRFGGTSIGGAAASYPIPAPGRARVARRRAIDGRTAYIAVMADASPLLARWLARSEEPRAAFYEGLGGRRTRLGPGARRTTTWQQAVGRPADRVARALLDGAPVARGRAGRDSSSSPGADFVACLLRRPPRRRLRRRPLAAPSAARDAYFCDDAGVRTVVVVARPRRSGSPSWPPSGAS